MTLKINKKHVCYEDNQGHCHNGCNRILNYDSCRGYHGDEGYMRLLEKRIHELECGFDAIANKEKHISDPQDWAEENLRKIAAEFEIKEFLNFSFQKDNNDEM